MQKLPSSMPRYVKSASFLQFHVVLVCFWTIGPIWTICGICGFLRSFVAKSPKVQKLLNFGRSRHSLGIAFYKLSTFRVVERPLKIESHFVARELESRRRRTKGSVVGEEWCQNAAPLRWYTKNVFAQSKMILSRAWLHDTVSCAAWNDARKGVYLKPLFKTPCSNCYWGWSIPIMLDYRDISLMESVPLMWGPVTASPVGIEPMTIFGGGGAPL